MKKQSKRIETESPISGSGLLRVGLPEMHLLFMTYDSTKLATVCRNGPTIYVL